MCDRGRGVCIWFTGRSGAGKSTVMRALVPLRWDAGRSVTWRDTVPELAKTWCEGSSRGKLLRKGYVAGEVVRHGGIAVCVTVSARAAVRETVRSMIGPEQFLEGYTGYLQADALARPVGTGQRVAFFAGLLVVGAREHFEQLGHRDALKRAALLADSGLHSESNLEYLFTHGIDGYVADIPCRPMRGSRGLG